jgi:queuine tRNA-ribosyltransferase
MEFEIIAHDPSTKARAGSIKTLHGVVETPAFMPVGTQGSVKSISPDELETLDSRMILANTYHLYLRPGADLIARMGGLHRFMGWNGSILTDSGGFQVFSLARIRKIEEGGVEFQSHIDGSRHFIQPETSIRVQEQLGSDIAMCFDECTPYPVAYEYALRSMELSIRWAARCKAVHRKEDQALFGIVQGSVFKDLRLSCLEQLMGIGFDGYAIGSLSVGESKDEMLDVLQHVTPRLPESRPRYLMGVGTPEDLVEGVCLGVDMFDCVMPTRNARNGMLFTSTGSIQIKNSRYADDENPVEPDCSCYTCRRFSRAYLRHLFMSRELLAYRLNTLHNLHHYLTLMKGMREAILAKRLKEWRQEFYRVRSVQ